jgi:hypothetical protein
MMGQLQAYGYRLVPDDQRASAHLWLLNSCTVKSPSQVCWAVAVPGADGSHLA